MSDVVPDAMNPMVNKAQYLLLRNHVIVEDRKKTYKYLQTYHLLEADEVALMLVPEFGLRLVV